MSRPNCLRESIIHFYRLGLSPTEIARKFSVPRQTVHRAISRYKQMGTTKDRPRSGRPKTASTKKNMRIIQKRIQRNPKRGIRSIARSLGISKDSAARIIHRMLKSYPYRMRKGHGLTAVHIANRLERCKMLLKRAEKGEHMTTVYSDEKLFTVEEVYNNQKTRIIAISAEDADKKGRTVSLSHFKDEHWTFQQDLAPAHRAKVTQSWGATHLPDFIPSSEWPPCSPDLNPLDFSVWSVLEKEACSTRHPSLDSLKQALKDAWEKIDTDYLRAVIESIPRRLRAVIAANGGHFE